MNIAKSVRQRIILSSISRLCNNNDHENCQHFRIYLGSILACTCVCHFENLSIKQSPSSGEIQVEVDEDGSCVAFVDMSSYKQPDRIRCFP
jgi:hypothetical protein